VKSGQYLVLELCSKLFFKVPSKAIFFNKLCNYIEDNVY